MSDDEYVEAESDDASRLIELLPENRLKPRFGSNSFPKKLPDWDIEDVKRARESFPIVK